MAELDQEQVQESFEGGLNDGSDIAKSLSNLLDSLTDEKQDKLLTELSAKEINHISVLEATGDDTTKEFLNEYRKHKVSNKRRGRKELIKVSNAISSVFQASEGGRLDAMRDKLGL